MKRFIAFKQSGLDACLFTQAPKLNIQWQSIGFGSRPEHPKKLKKEKNYRIIKNLTFLLRRGEQGAAVLATTTDESRLAGRPETTNNAALVTELAAGSRLKRTTALAERLHGQESDLTGAV